MPVMRSSPSTQFCGNAAHRIGASVTANVVGYVSEEEVMPARTSGQLPPAAFRIQAAAAAINEVEDEAV